MTMGEKINCEIREKDSGVSVRAKTAVVALSGRSLSAH